MTTTTVSRVFRRGLVFACLTMLLPIDAPRAQLEVKQLTHPMATVDRGLVFQAGGFVPGPYELGSREADGRVTVVVAGMDLDRFPVPAPDKVDTRRLSPPPPHYTIPAGVTSLRQSGYPEYLDRVLKDRAGIVGFDEALREIEARAARSPLVTRTKRIEDGLLLYGADSQPHFVGGGPELVAPVLTRQEALMLADRSLAVYRELLDRGGAILCFENAFVFLPRLRVQELLLPSVEILEDPELDRATRRTRLLQRWKNEVIVEELLGGFRATPAFRAAVRPYTRGR